jgi:glyoxylase-like metal-dependent hydrolase (beta-lactamase superfamily II)
MAKFRSVPVESLRRLNEMPMTPLGAGLDYFDLGFLGQPGIIATGLLAGADGVALIDPGPSTTLRGLEQSLAGRGVALSDVRSILLTHIHLDHAGATGSLVADCPNATVFVHEAGAPHLVDPTKLIASASRLYGADMERLWGEIRAVPADRIRAIADERLHVAGRTIEVARTPGHASHHVSFYLPDSGVAFVGDTAGICRASGRVVLPATPPPDIDLDAWRRSTSRILDWNPDVLFLTHFGPQRAPRVHFGDLWARMEEWSGRVQASIARPGTDEDRAKQFTAEVMEDLARATSRDEAAAYSSAARFDFSWAGLARYWRRKDGGKDVKEVKDVK